MYLKISNMFFPILQPPTFIYIFVMFLLLVRENEVNSKTSRVRTNYKLRVGEQRVGRYTPYSQVRLPSTGEYPYGEAENYYKHAKISEWYKGKRRLKSKMEIDPATQNSSASEEVYDDSIKDLKEMLVYMNAMLITSGLLICEASELTIIFFLIKNNDVYF
ncbi:uncharacterized protein [Lepeophtheirus salmonis]|uniref:uncharacterized protein isoform X4 n=1 Tax=Lepeophtheirus salmonis TaxID=72036 RepID=UPI003AF3AF96